MKKMDMKSLLIGAVVGLVAGVLIPSLYTMVSGLLGWDAQVTDTEE
jgi:hypothetical protein